MKNRIIAFLFVLAAVLITGCTGGDIIERRYYIFEYLDGTERPGLLQANPLPYSLIVQDSRIAQTYTRKQIVKRHYGPQIQYLVYDQWGIKLSDAIPDLVAKRCTKYNLFTSVDRNLLTGIPDYQINTSVINMEMYETQFLSEARLNMEFTFFRLQEDNSKVPDLSVTHSFDRTKRIPKGDVEAFVQAINEMILKETNNFVVKILNEFSGKKESLAQSVSQDSGYEVVDYSAEVSGDSTTTDDRSIGLLYLPNLSGQDNEPFYKVLDMKGNDITTARFGEEMPLKEGKYMLHYGSGGDDQGMYQSVEIRPRWRYNVFPNWGCLIVDVMDEQRNYVKTGYNVFDNENGYDYGIEYPADVNLGEKQTVWILKPGTYKVTINSESFNTYRDFTTIEVEENACQRLTLVVEEDEVSGIVSMIGAGVMNEEERQRKDSNWIQKSAIHVNFNLKSDNSTEKNNSVTSLTMSGQLDNTLTYNYGRLNYRMKNLIEVGTNKDEGFNEFRIDLDDFDLKNTVILNVISSIGLYGRLDMNTHIFPSYIYNLDYVELNADSIYSEPHKDANRYRATPSLFPLTLKEGIGLNFKFLDTSRADMNLRAGLGLRQDFRNNVYSYDGETTIDTTDYKVYKEVESSNDEGIEASLVGDLQIMRNLNYSLTADVLFPFNDMQNYTMDMENIFNIKLFKYISIDYRLKFFTRETDGKLDYIANQQSLFLRFTYILR
ncbi:MAG: DUF481 domain-containing protein [Candidatus Cloacimonetes bacterium]|nr:DUF481 domain-containing protein [Candidatus Cloacimonadota bacterium]